MDTKRPPSTAVLDSAQAQLKALLDATVDAIILIDGEGLIQEFNRSAETLFGYARTEVLGRNVSLLMPEPYRSEHDDYIQRYRDTDEARIIGIGREVTARRSDGTEFPIDLAVGEITENDGPARFVGILRDISRRRRAEEEAAAHRDALMHISRLSTIAEMGTGIAHEINQPLTAISAYARASTRLLADEPPDIEAARNALERIAEQAQRGSQILRRLRNMAQRRDSERKRVSVADLLNDLRPLAEIDVRQHGIDLTWKLGRNLPAIEADPVQVQQVLANLLHNAAEAMDETRGKDHIVISAQRVDRESVAVSVRDYGPGLPENEDAETLMEAFVTHKPDGLGIGLGICRSIVTAHGGSLSLRNAGDMGAIATFILPVAGDE